MDREKSVDQDRRRYYRLSPEVEVTCSIEGMEVVHLVGLGASGAGMRVITDRELPAGQPFAVRLATGPGEALDLRARAVWKAAWDFDFCSRHVAGVEFIDLADADRARLTALLPPPGERSEATDTAS